MDVVMTGRGVVITQALRDYADEKLKRLARYSFKPIKVMVRLAVEKYRHRVEIVLSVDGSRILVKEETDEMYQSIDRAMEKIEQRLRRYKEKFSQHKPSTGGRSPARAVVKSRPVIVREPSIISTLSLEDAMARLKTMRGSGFVFYDDDDHKLKLLLREKEDRFEMTELVID